jgi:carboxypeptidase family protein/TonB-dependent receptor-like protein
MNSGRRQSIAACRPSVLWIVAATTITWSHVVSAQGLTGALVGTVRDAHGGALAGASVRLSSPALIGGPQTIATNQKGQLRFSALPPGPYTLDVVLDGFEAHHEDGIAIGASRTVDRTIVLTVAGLRQSIEVRATASHIEARDPGISTRFGHEDLQQMPTRRTSMFDFIRATPGASPTSPSSATATTVSMFGSGTNENMFLIDGTNFTCPCNGVARSEPGVDFIQEIHVQSVGASAEYGNIQGGVINVITRQGSDRFLYDASYYGQAATLTSQPVRLPIRDSTGRTSGYERARYRDLTTNVGGPAVRGRLWFFGGYQYLRDYDSQPGSDPQYPRTYEQNKLFAKLTWRLAPGWHLVQSLHHEAWVNPEPPTFAKPFETTLRLHASVPAVTYGDLTHTSTNTVWNMRVGRFVYDRVDDPSTGDVTTPSHTDRVTGITSGAPPQFGGLTLIRTTAKATLTQYRAGGSGVDHEWKVGAQVEKGEAHGPNVIPTGIRYDDRNGLPFRSISSDPSHSGGMFVTVAGFASDAMTLGSRFTINAGLRFDHSQAMSQDLPSLDSSGHETDRIVKGLGTLYTWNLWSPRFGLTAKLTADGRTLLRSSYGRFNQGILTGEYSAIHPAISPVTTRDYVAADGDYTRIRSIVDSSSLVIDSHMRAPHSDEFSIGVDRELARDVSLAIAYVHKQGADFIAWTDVGGHYDEVPKPLADGRSIPAFVLTNSTSSQRFLLTNPTGYFSRYRGVVTALEKRRTHGWQAFGSYTYSRAVGLQASSGATAAAPQSSTVALPNGPFGRDPNDLTNASGRLPNDRPHVFRAMASVDVPKTGIVLATNMQAFSGKPWAATTLLDLPQNSQQRVLIEPRGTRRLSSQSLLDVRLSKAFSFGDTRIELLFDVLNALNDRAEEALVTDVLLTETVPSNPDFGQPTLFMDPRRVMLGVRLNVGR